MDAPQKKTVLIVDDDLEFTKSFAEKLEEQGLNAIVAVTPKEGLDTITNKRVDFIVLDFVMPEMDGTMVHNIMQRDMRQNIPTIFLTSFPEAKNIPQNLEVYVKLDTNLETLAKDIKQRLDH